MNEYITSPVTPIVILAMAVVGMAIVLVVASRRHKKQLAAAKAEVGRERRRRIEADRQRLLAEQRKAKPESMFPRLLSRNADGGSKKPARHKSVPAPGRSGFRTDAPSQRGSDDGFMNNAIMGGLLFGGMNDNSNDSSRNTDPSPSHDPSPTPSPSYDSGSSSSSYDGGSSSSSYDSGSSSGYDSGGSFSSGGGGDF